MSSSVSDPESELKELLESYRLSEGQATESNDNERKSTAMEASALFGRASTQAAPLIPPPLPYTGDVDCRWIRNGDPNNPFQFDVLDLTDIISTVPESYVAPGNPEGTEQSANELAQSFRLLAQQILPQIAGQSPSSADVSAMHSMQESVQDALDSSGTPKDNFRQHSIVFDPPLVVRVPVTKGQFDAIDKGFAMPTRKPSDNSDSSNDSASDLPPMQLVQKAAFGGGRYDVYLTGEFPSLFFATTTSLAIKDKLPKDGTVAIERHHVVILASPPRVTRVLPSQIHRLVIANLHHTDDPVHGYIEFTCKGVVSSYDSTDRYGPPPSDVEFRKREVDFLIRNAVFGVTLPAPLPPSLFSEALAADLEGRLKPEDSQRWREVAARYAVGMYGHCSTFASVRSPLEYPAVHSKFMKDEPSLLLMYDDPAKYFGSSS